MNESVYYVILWREGKENWGWLRSLDPNEDCTTEYAYDRMRWATVERARAALWAFCADAILVSTERLSVVRVTTRPPRKLLDWYDTCQHLDCQKTATWRTLTKDGRIVRGSYRCAGHRGRIDDE
jgi:hypothetical protein